MTRLFSLLIFLTIIVVAFLSLKPGSERSAEAVKGLPWQIEILPEGRTRVMGVTLGQSTLADARAQFGEDMELAVIMAPGEQEGGLEMFYPHYRAGVFPGKLVIAADAAPEVLAQMMEHFVKSEYMDSGARKFTLDQADVPLALRSSIASLTFIPMVNLDEATAVKRFGPPAERVPGKGQVTHLLYPDKGLDLMLNEGSKDVLQYVAPRDFDRLRAPLLEER